MQGLGLLVGHLLGDVIFQGDWLARYKSVPYHGGKPEAFLRTENGLVDNPAIADDWLKWQERRRDWWIGHLACTLHCAIYTVMIFLTMLASRPLPWWAALVIFGTHWPIDRFRLARHLMWHMGMEKFATGQFSCWSVILVDQTLHLAILYFLGCCPWL